MEIFLATYVVLVILNLLYTEKDKLPVKAKYIVAISGKTRWLTRNRLAKALELKKKYPEAQLAICGKELNRFMQQYLLSHNVKRFVKQEKSTNTNEDAVYLAAIINPNSDIILVTNESHQRRAWHSFGKVFKGIIYNCPTSDQLTFYSPLLPIGIMASLINMVKDFKYNKRLY